MLGETLFLGSIGTIAIYLGTAWRQPFDPMVRWRSMRMNDLHKAAIEEDFMRTDAKKPA